MDRRALRLGVYIGLVALHTGLPHALARTIRIVRAESLQVSTVDNQELIVLTGGDEQGADVQPNMAQSNMAQPSMPQPTPTDAHSNWVELQVDGDTVRAQRIEFNRTRRTLTLVGEGVYDSVVAGKAQHVQGKDLVVLLDAQSLSGQDVLVSDDQISIQAQELERVPGRINAAGSYFTACARCGRTPNDYAVKASRLVLYPGDRLIAYGATILLADTPVFYLPVLAVPLNDRARQPRVSAGRDATDGITLGADLPFAAGSNILGTTLLRYYQNRPAHLGLGVDMSVYTPAPYLDRLDVYALAVPKSLVTNGADATGYDLDYTFSAKGHADLPHTLAGLSYSLSGTRRQIDLYPTDSARGVTFISGLAQVTYTDVPLVKTVGVELAVTDRRGPAPTTALGLVLRRPELTVDPGPVVWQGNRAQASADFRFRAGQYMAASNPLNRAATRQGLNFSTWRLEEQHQLSYAAQPWKAAEFVAYNNFTGHYYLSGQRVVNLDTGLSLTQYFGVRPVEASPTQSGITQGGTAQSGALLSGLNPAMTPERVSDVYDPSDSAQAASLQANIIQANTATVGSLAGFGVGAAALASPGLVSSGLAGSGLAGSGLVTPLYGPSLGNQVVGAQVDPQKVLGSWTVGFKYLRREGLSPFAFDRIDSTLISAPISLALTLTPRNGVLLSASQSYDLLLPASQQEAARFGVNIARGALLLSGVVQHNFWTGQFKDVTVNGNIGRATGLNLAFAGNYTPSGTSLLITTLSAIGRVRTNRVSFSVTSDLGQHTIQSMTFTASAVRLRDAVLNPVTFDTTETLNVQTQRLDGSLNITWRNLVFSSTHSLSAPGSADTAQAARAGLDTLYFSVGNMAASGGYGSYTNSWAADSLTATNWTATNWAATNWNTGGWAGGSYNADWYNAERRKTTLNWTLKYGGPYDLTAHAWATPALSLALSAERPSQRISTQVSVALPGTQRSSGPFVQAASLGGMWQLGSRAAISGLSSYSRTDTPGLVQESLSLQPLTFTTALGPRERPAAYLSATFRQTLSWQNGIRTDTTPFRPIVLLTVDRCCWAFQAEVNPIEKRFRLGFVLAGGSQVTAFEKTTSGVSFPFTTLDGQPVTQWGY